MSHALVWMSHAYEVHLELCIDGLAPFRMHAVEVLPSDNLFYGKHLCMEWDPLSGSN